MNTVHWYRPRAAVATALSGLLLACGGGGGDPGTGEPAAAQQGAGTSAGGTPSPGAPAASAPVTADSGGGTTGTGTSGGTAPTGPDTTTMPTRQGALQATGRPLDVAIDGAGLFVFRDAADQLVYSRSGRFDVDRDGQLVHAEGWRLAGRPSDAAPTDTAVALAPISYAMAGQATSHIWVDFNLDLRSQMVPFDEPFALDQSVTYSLATSLPIYDPAGVEIALNLYFAHVDHGRWHVYAAAEGVQLPGPIAALQFDASGRLIGPTEVTLPDLPALAGAWSGHASAPMPGPRIHWPWTTQYLAASGVTLNTIDGYRPGWLVGVDIASDGRLVTRYDNGQQRTAGQLLLARFALAEPLQRVGGSGLRAVRENAAPIVAPPGQRLLGALVAGSLEQAP